MPPVSNREQFDWDHRIQYLLKDSFAPKTFDHYKEVVGEGLDNAKMYLQAKSEVNPTIGTINAVHKIAFGSIYKEAGLFRHFGQEIAIGRDGDRGAYHSQIAEELELLSDHLRDVGT